MEGSVKLAATLKKLKTLKKKYFVLLASSNDSGPRLEYFDSEKKFKSATQKAKHPILMQSCLNINKRADQKHKYILVLFTKEESFGLIFDNEETQNEWFKAMVALQSSIGITKQRYDHVWEVLLKEKGLSNIKCLSAGHYRMYLTNRNIGFMHLNQEEPDLELQLATIRSCGHADNFFHLEIGSAAKTGAARVWMQVEDAVIAQNMHEIVLSIMKSSSRDQEMKPPLMFRHRSKSSVDRNQRPTSIRRQSASFGDSHTLPRRPKPKMRHSTIGTSESHSTQLRRRSTYTSSQSHSQGSAGAGVVCSNDAALPRCRTDSMSSHGSHRTDHSAQSSDVEQDNSFHTHSGHLGNPVKSGPEKAPMRKMKSKDIMVTASSIDNDNVDANNSYMEMNASSLKPTSSTSRNSTRMSESSDTTTASAGAIGAAGGLVGGSGNYFAMMGTSPANSTTSSSGYPFDDGGYFEMNHGTATSASPAGSNREIDGGYMEMAAQGGVVRSNSASLRPDKVSSLLSDDSSCGGLDEFPPRANSVGSKPTKRLSPEKLCDTYAYMDMSSSPAGSSFAGSNPGVHRAGNDKSSSAPHLPDHGGSTNPLLRNHRANSPAIRSNDSSRSTTPRSGTPSNHQDSDQLMELDFDMGSSHESLGLIRSRTSSAGSRDFYSSGFGGSHDMRDRTSSWGSRDSSSRFHSSDGSSHRPRTSTIGQETLRPRTSSFGPSEMRPRALSHGTRYKELSRRVKEKQLRQQQEPLTKHRVSSREGFGSFKASSAIGVPRPASEHMGASGLSRSQEYGKSLTLPEEEYMLVMPPPNSINMSSSPKHIMDISGQKTPPRGSGGGNNTPHHSTPTHEAHAHSTHHHHHRPKSVHASMENKASPGSASTIQGPGVTSLNSQGGSVVVKRSASYRSKERNPGSSSESLSSSSSEMGGVKSKHGSRGGAMKALIGSTAKSPGVIDSSDYIDATLPAANTSVPDEVEDTYILYEPGKDHTSMNPAYGLEKVISPIRDDISTLSTFQIVQSPIKEEDNDALFGPKPKTLDPETVERLRHLKHEYVNVDFENAKNDLKKSELLSSDKVGVSDGNSENVLSVEASPKATTKDADTSLGYHSAKEHEYMDIDLSKVSQSSSNSDIAKQSSPESSAKATTNAQANITENNNKNDSPNSENKSTDRIKSDSVDSNDLPANRFHDYCEINFEDVKSSPDNNKPSPSKSNIPDPFGELFPPLATGNRDSTDSDNQIQTETTKTPSPTTAPIKITNTSNPSSSSKTTSDSSLSPTDSTTSVNSVIMRHRHASRDSARVGSCSSPVPIADPFGDLMPPQMTSTISALSSLSKRNDSANQRRSGNEHIDNVSTRDRRSGERSSGSRHSDGSSVDGGEAGVGTNNSPSPGYVIEDVFNLGAKPSSPATTTQPKGGSTGSDDSRNGNEVKRSTEKARRVSHGELKANFLASNSSSLSSGNPIKTNSQASLSARLESDGKNNSLRNNSSTSLISLDTNTETNNSKSQRFGAGVGNGSNQLSSPGCRRSYHEQNLNSPASDATKQQPPQLNYAKLDLSVSTDEPGLNLGTSGNITPSLHKSTSFTSHIDDSSAPVSYAQIDFEKSEQLKQSEQQKKTKSDTAPPFDCI